MDLGGTMTLFKGPSKGPSNRLFNGLFDDAALFPPGNAPMASAVPAHRGHLAAWYGELVGPFLCPDSRLAELGAVLDDGAPDAGGMGLGLVVPGGSRDVAAAVETVRADPRLRLVAVEVVADREVSPAEGVCRAAAALAAHLPAGTHGYVEVPREGVQQALDALAATPYRAKFRTGGVVPEAFPSEAEVAKFIRGCVDRDLAFKCTAGLHHAVRNTDPAAGFEQHGFLNVLLHTDALIRWARTSGLLAERSPAAVGASAGRLTGERAGSVRDRFVSFGTCSITEPIDDLIALGLLEKPHADVAATA